MHALARGLAKRFPDKTVEVVETPDGDLAIRIGELCYFSLPPDGTDGTEGAVLTHIAGDHADVVRLDGQWQEIESYTVRLGDPDAN
jgi:hypothetical protein